MLRFVPSSGPAKLINSLFQITVRREGGKYEVTATQLLPPGVTDSAIAKKIELFSYPDPTSIERGTFLTFLIREGDDFQIGFALYSTLHSALVVMTNYCYRRIFRTLLRLPKQELLDVAGPLCEAVRRDSVSIRGRPFSLDGACERQRLMKLLFTTFPPYDISKIIIGMIQARHIFVVSSSAGTASAIASALSLLIEPFRWDGAVIPLLPLQIMDMVQSPIPILIGLTRIGLLNTDQVSAHVCINCDVKLVMDTPVFEENSPNRFKILGEQLKFAQAMTALLTTWKPCKGFPHEIVASQVQRFIVWYLQVYTGACAASEDFLMRISQMPEYVAGSQVFAELERFDELEPKRKKAFTNWFAQVFPRDMSVQMKKVIQLDKNGEILD